MKKIAGVESVKVLLNEGVAILRLKPGNSVSVEKVRQVVLDNGFTPKGADVEIAGEVIERNGKPALHVPGPELVYLLSDKTERSGRVNELWRKARGKDVVVKGHLPETTTKGRAQEQRVLEVRGFALAL